MLYSILKSLLNRWMWKLKRPSWEICMDDFSSFCTILSLQLRSWFWRDDGGCWCAAHLSRLHISTWTGPEPLSQAIFALLQTKERGARNYIGCGRWSFGAPSAHQGEILWCCSKRITSLVGGSRPLCPEERYVVHTHLFRLECREIYYRLLIIRRIANYFVAGRKHK